MDTDSRQSDEEVIERVLGREGKMIGTASPSEAFQALDELKEDQALDAPDLARRLRSALSRLVEVERERDEARAINEAYEQNHPSPKEEVGETKFYWLVEAPGPHYLGVRKLPGYEFYWTPDVNKALRFTTKHDADFTSMAVRALAPQLWAFATTLGEAWPREHGFING